MAEKVGHSKENYETILRFIIEGKIVIAAI